MSHPVSPEPTGKARRRRGPANSQALSGWLFVSPVILILGLFLFIPILMALWVSVSDWSGNGSPFDPSVNFVGAKNYEAILGGKGLTGRDFGMAIRNNLYYVLFVVPLQTIVSLFLAVMVTRKGLKGKSVFRTAFYFPSVTSSVAITVLWLFLFNASGAVNKALSWLGIHGPNWFQDPRGVLGLLLEPLGVHETGALAKPGFLGISAYQWLQGPSVAMCAFILMAIFTTSGTFMLLFIAALQNIGEETDEAGMMDGATAWQRFRHITLPMLKPTLYTVITLGLIGTWQVFDQIVIGSQGGPAKTTMTPAYLSYTKAFNDNEWGRGAAIAFVLFAIIVLMTILQRFILGDADYTTLNRRQRKAEKLDRERAARREVDLVTHGGANSQTASGGGVA
ncbi:carbohydrate ABC transporter permease [Luteococcus sp. OSA5]|uniref:carbohydrate ABC transporter permease n=1 Tax=Luteococcus sp. OSA5 TaxID=3401630 RepID=UPI003B434CBA